MNISCGPGVVTMPIRGRTPWAALMVAVALLLPAVASAQNAYITNFNSNTVSVIDTANNEVGPPIPVGHGPFGVAAIPNSTKVYVTNFNDNTVSAIDLAPPDKGIAPPIPVSHGPYGVAVTPLRVGHGPFGIAVTPNGAKVFVTNFKDTAVSVIDTATNKVTAIPVDHAPSGIAVTSDGTKIYVANSGSDTVWVVDTATNKAVGPPIPVGHAPSGVAVTPDSTKVYVANSGSDAVSVIDTATNKVVGPPIPVGHAPYGVAVTPDGKHAYVASFDSNIFVIDTATNKVVGPPILAGRGAYGVAVTPDGTKVYVGNVIDNTVSVIDTGLNKVNRPVCMMARATPPCITARLSVGHGPVAFGTFIAWPWQPMHKRPGSNASGALATTRSQLAPSAAQAQPAQVQKVSNTTTGSAALAATLPVAATNGNTIVVTASGFPAPASISISDTLGNTYTLAGTIATSSANEFVAIYYAKNIRAGTDTITLAGSASGQFSMTAAEFSGLDTTSPLDGSATAQGSNAAPSSGLMTPSTSGDLVIGAATHGFTTTTTAGAGFTMLAVATEDDAAHQPLATEYQTLAGTNPIAASFSLAASGSWLVNAALFKPAANTPPAAPSIQSFIATPPNITAGSSSTLSWSVSGNPAPTLSIDNGVGAVTGTSVSVTPAATTTYTLVATNSVGSTSASTTVTVNANDAAHNGQWSSPIATPMVLVHGLLLNNGKILAWSSGDQARIFDPATSSFTQVPDLITDVLCAGEVRLSNGNPLSVGGESFGPPSKHADIFNLASSTWSAAAPLNMARWYPTATVLPDGRVLATSGEGPSIGAGYVPVPEIYNPKINAWTMMAASASNPNTPNYPFMYVLPDGRVAFTGASEYDTITQILDLNSQTWSTVDNAILPGSSAVMYQPGKVMKSGEAADSGFSGPATSTTYVIDFNQPTPAWRKTANMAYPRSFENLTALPDGTVLVTGGDTTKNGTNAATAVKAAELWNPITETWSTMASEQRPRLYHSIAILMPDGRVFVSGGGNDSPPMPNELTAEYYSPPYLFKGARPIISSAPGTVQYGSQFFVATPDAATIASVALIKASAVTHFTNMEQRFMNLSFAQTSGGLTVNAPANSNLATPGVYMLFIVNNNGVPSVAPLVTLPSSFDDTQPPSAPINLVANGSIGAASLSWSASTDNVGVANYNVHRSGVSGFTPTITNRIAQPTTTTYTDSGLAAGTYYYVVTAQDAAGNVSGASNEASAIVTSDTQPPTVSITTPLSGSTVSSTITVAATATDNVAVASVQFQLDSINLGAADTTAPYQINWDTTTATNGSHTLTAVARDTSGNVATSSAITVTVNNVAPPSSTLSIDKTVFKDQDTGSTVTTASFSTASSNELLLAFISADAYSGSPTTVTQVSTAGLVWTLVKRTNTQFGTAEVWRAFATSALTNVTVAATLSQSVASSMTVVTFTGSDGAGTSGGIGATLSASAASGAPTGTITTTRNNSLVFGVGVDWDNPIARTLGPNQTMVHQYLASVGDTYWIQRQNAPTPISGTNVTINDTAPTGDRYNLSIVEVLPKP
jgi:YVTN family beta-propeller protein